MLPFGAGKPGTVNRSSGIGFLLSLFEPAFQRLQGEVEMRGVYPYGLA